MTNVNGLTEVERKELEALEAKMAVVLVSSQSGRAQADAAVKLLEANNGTVTAAQLATINPKYPSDPIYYARKLYGLKISTIRARGGNSKYVLLVTRAEQARIAELKAKMAASAQNPAPSANAATSSK